MTTAGRHPTARGRLTACVLLLGALTAGCAQADRTSHDADSPAVEGTATSVAEGSAGPAGASAAERTSREQAFLDDLTTRGLHTDTAPDTAVEVGLGICRGLSEGVDAREVLDRIRPLTRALAAQSGVEDPASVGRDLVQASRTHLCD